jgi:hypothetical protein
LGLKTPTVSFTSLDTDILHLYTDDSGYYCASLTRLRPFLASFSRRLFDGLTGDVYTAFHEWLLDRGYTEEYARYLTRCVREHWRDYLGGNLSAILERKSQNFLAAGSALFRFLGRYDEWKMLLHRHGVSWKKRGQTYFLGLILGRSNLVDELLTWMDAVKQRFPGKDGLQLPFLV